MLKCGIYFILFWRLINDYSYNNALSNNASFLKCAFELTIQLLLRQTHTANHFLTWNLNIQKYASTENEFFPHRFSDSTLHGAGCPGHSVSESDPAGHWPDARKHRASVSLQASHGLDLPVMGET